MAETASTWHVLSWGLETLSKVIADPCPEGVAVIGTCDGLRLRPDGGQWSTNDAMYSTA